jgi:hypothetical protein
MIQMGSYYSNFLLEFTPGGLSDTKIWVKHVVQSVIFLYKKALPVINERRADVLSRSFFIIAPSGICPNNIV